MEFVIRLNTVVRAPRIGMGSINHSIPEDVSFRPIKSRNLFRPRLPVKGSYNEYPKIRKIGIKRKNVNPQIYVKMEKNLTFCEWYSDASGI